MYKNWNLGLIKALDDEEQESLLVQFCKESSLHGLKFIGQRGKRLVERIFWGTAFGIAVILAVVSIRQVWKKYTDTPVITVFKPEETPVRLISFPAVTICNSNNILREKVEELIKKSNEPNPQEALLHKLFMVDQICSSTKMVSEQFNFIGNTEKLPKETRNKILKYKESYGFRNNNQSIPEFLLEVTDDCDEMIILCLWNGQKQNCSNIFQSVVSDFGRCCSFNMIPSDLLLNHNSNYKVGESSPESGWSELEMNSDTMILPKIFDEDGKRRPPKFPRRQKRPGKASGFTIAVNPKLDSYYCANLDSAGFMVLPHSPLQFPRMVGRPIAIFPGFENFLQLQADVTLASYEISGYKAQDRNCYFGNEFSLQFYKFYTMSNCEDECVANLTYTSCHCVHHFMPRNQTMEVCGPDSLSCIEHVTKKVARLGSGKMCPVCLPTCTEINYEPSITYLPIRNDVDLWVLQNGTKPPWSKENISIISIYFSGDATYPKVRTKLYGPIELISSIGGLLSLCLGFSILSLLEILYFLTFRVYFVTFKVITKTNSFAQVVVEAMKQYGLTLKSKLGKWKSATRDVRRPAAPFTSSVLIGDSRWRFSQ